jgi:hypothetical protein
LSVLSHATFLAAEANEQRRLAVTRLHLGIGIAVALGAIGVTRDARATLGGDAGSIATNQQRLGATRQVKPLAHGEYHELRLPSGPVVRQYVSASGTVYAVSWHGHGMPNLQELLGAYFTQLSSGRRRGGHHHLALTGNDLVIQSAGHGRLFSGRAWVPSLVPTGVDPETSVEYGQ